MAVREQLASEQAFLSVNIQLYEPGGRVGYLFYPWSLCVSSLQLWSLGSYHEPGTVLRGSATAQSCLFDRHQKRLP